jgi:hypothetical protein
LGQDTSCQLHCQNKPDTIFKAWPSETTRFTIDPRKNLYGVIHYAHAKPARFNFQV